MRFRFYTFIVVKYNKIKMYQLTLSIKLEKNIYRFVRVIVIY